MTLTVEADNLEKLLGRVSSSDREAFRDLYAATSAKLFGVVLRIIKDRDQAADVLQESYLKVWQNADRYDAGQGRPITWMAAIARNTAIDVLRRRKPVNETARESDMDPLENLADEHIGGIDPAHRETLRGCLGELEEIQRDCVVLAYCEGYSRQELGDRYGKPEATVKTWLRRGLMRLKDCMDR